jgi:HAE1 family hydrophobic/amphiphilic exporter-1
MLVDNAVVVTESVFRHRQLDPTRPGAATLAGVREVGVATIAGTAATVIVFLPMVFGEKNEIAIFLTHVAIPIVVAMLASLLVAQTLVPLLAARLRRAHVVASPPSLTRLQDAYARRLRWVLAHPWKTGGLVALTLASVVPLFAAGLVKVDPFPQDATRTLYLDYRIEGNHPLEQVERAVNRVEAYLEGGREQWEIDNVYSRYDATSANTLIYLKPKRAAKRRARDIMDEIAKGMPEVIIGRPTFDFGADPGGGFSLQLSGESTEVLADLSLEVVRRLRQVPGFDAVRSAARGGDQEIEVAVDRARAMQAGLPTETVALTIAGAMRGDRLREFRGPDRELTMRLAFRADDRQSLEDLARLPIPRADGTTVPLAAVATFRMRPGERAIERVNRLTAVVVTGTLAKGVTLDELRDRVKPVLEAFPWPAGYTWKFGRGFEQNDETLNAMATNIGLAIVLIFLVMAALFESTLHPLSIVTSIVFAIVGVFWFFALTGTPVTLMAMIGIMILVGVVVNIGIVLIAHVISLRAAGMERTAAIVQAGRDRLRPILMTTATTLLGLVPLGWGDAQVGGTGGPAYYPMARAIIGGLAFGAAVSLFFVPAFYVWFDDLNAWRVRVFARRGTASGATAAPG